MKIWQRNAVVATVVLFVAVSIYLSWSYGTPANEGEVPVYQPQTELTASPEIMPTSTAQADAVDTADSSYFADARMSRQRARDSALDILNGAAGREEAAQDLKDQAAAEIQLLAQQAMKEAAIEGLIKAKGFADCVAYISGEGIRLVIAAPASGLTANDVTKIKDICLSETDLTIDDIYIMEV